MSIWDDFVTTRLGLEGVLVRNVTAGGPAATAGIRPTEFENSRPTRAGDLIVAVNGKTVRNSLDLFRILDQYKAGDTVTVALRRERGDLEVPVTLKVLD